MAYGAGGERSSQIDRCVEQSASYHLDSHDARGIFEHQIGVIRRDWNEVCDLARLTRAEREQLWGRQFLNPYSLGEQ